MLDEGPSKLYDALSKILGLDDLVDAQDAAPAGAQHARQGAEGRGTRSAKTLLAAARGSTTSAPRSVSEALGKKDWGLSDARGRPRRIRRRPRAGQRPPRPAAPRPSSSAPTQNAVDGGRPKPCGRRTTRQQAAAQTLAGKSERPRRPSSTTPSASTKPTATATAPSAARRARSTATGTSRRPRKPRASATGRAEKPPTRTTQARQRRRKAEALPSPDGRVARPRQRLGLDAAAPRSALDAWRAGLQPTAELDALAEHIERAAAAARSRHRQLRDTAAAELAAPRRPLAPVALALAEWLPKASKAQKGRRVLKLLKAARSGSRRPPPTSATSASPRSPTRPSRIWNQLRLQSNVSLEDIHLGGAGTSAQVELKVTVDGQEGAALGVMSQGELHSLALSLFIPRATLPESPFRFVVIDDPVQSMDPARVDGLARVLQTARKNRQVVVFTHDDRLPEAVRRLGIPATVIEVTRREGSRRRACAASKDPVSRYIEDAMALAKTDDLPAEVARRVVPGLCREAIEAACMEAVRRRRIGRGEPHADVEDLLAEPHRHQVPRRPGPLRRRGARRRRPPAPQQGEQGRRRHLPRRERRQPTKTSPAHIARPRHGAPRSSRRWMQKLS